MRGCRGKETKRRGREEERERNSAKVEKKGGRRRISGAESSAELHTEELENALFRLHSHRFRWVCREREIPAK